MERICKRCGRRLSRFAFKRVCRECQAGRGRLFEDFPRGRPGPEIPTAIESDPDRH